MPVIPTNIPTTSDLRGIERSYYYAHFVLLPPPHASKRHAPTDHRRSVGARLLLARGEASGLVFVNHTEELFRCSTRAGLGLPFDRQAGMHLPDLHIVGKEFGEVATDELTS